MGLLIKKSNSSRSSSVNEIDSAIESYQFEQTDTGLNLYE